MEGCPGGVENGTGTNGSRAKWCMVGRGSGETIGVTGVEQSSKLGPMGDRERENILGKDHIGETGVVWASGPMGNRTGVC